MRELHPPGGGNDLIVTTQRGLRGDLKNSSAIYGIATLRIFGSETFLQERGFPRPPSLDRR